MTLSELYDQFCKQYHDGNDEALIVLLQDNAALLSTNTVTFDTQEAYESIAVAERPQFSYIADIKLWTITITDPIMVIEDKENLLLKLLAFKAILSRDITFLNKVRLGSLFYAKDDRIISNLLSVDEIKVLLPWAIMDGTSDVLHVLLKQLLLKTNGVFNLDEPLVDGLTPLELLSKSNNGPNTTFTKKMMLFYVATWDYFVGEAPTVENIHNLPQHFSLDQPHSNIERFLDLQAEEIAAKNDPSVSAVNAKDNPFFSKWGLCVGLSYRYGYYASRGLAHYYLMTIALLKLWEGTAAQLDKKLLDKELPAVLPQARFYKTLRELFEQWTNDISAFHSTNIDALILRPKTGIETQLPMTRFDLVKSEAEADTQLILIEYRHWNFGAYGTTEQFGEYLTYLTQIPNAYIAYGQNDHKTSISTLEGDGQTIHFDPGDIRDRDKLRKLGESDAYSVETLKDLITQAHPEWDGYPKHRSVLVYRYAGPGHKAPWEQSSIFKELPQTSVDAEAFQQASPNHFTHLHIAVLVQDTKTVKEILAAKKVDVLAKDDYGRYAIDVAVANAYWEGVELLLAEAEIKSFYLSDDMIKHLVECGYEDFVFSLMQNEKVRYKSTPLHIAIWIRDTKKIAEILAAKVVDISAEDEQGRCVIDIAVANAYWEGVELLLAEEAIKYFYLSVAKITHLVKYKREDFILRLIQLQHRKVSYSLVDVLELSMLYNGTKIIEAIKALFLQNPQRQQSFLLNIIQIFFHRQEEWAMDLFIFMTKDLDEVAIDNFLNSFTKDEFLHQETTLLQKALLDQNYKFAKLLLEKGANPNEPIRGGFYHGKTARQLLAGCGKLDLIPEAKRAWDEKLQIEVRNKFLFFTTKIEEAGKHFQERINGMVSSRNLIIRNQ